VYVYLPVLRYNYGSVVTLMRPRTINCVEGSRELEGLEKICKLEYRKQENDKDKK
jgi:hypothetical protein